MNMKRLLTLVAFFATVKASAQQVNPVPDYVFANRMSAGRNTVTDTAAYFSIGPRYGATRGMMPPMVVDIASSSANKRNGLLIFSIQKNKFLYWDSVGVKWAEMAGTGGSAITGSGVAGYMPEFTTTTNIDTTRLYHSAGRFAIGSTTTSNGVFNVYGGQSYFDTSLKVGSQTFLADEGKNEVFVNTTTDAGSYNLQVGGTIYSTNGGILAASSGDLGIGVTPKSKLHVNGKITINNTHAIGFVNATGGTDAAKIFLFSNNEMYYDNPDGDMIFRTSSTFNERMRLNISGELILSGNGADAGDYKLQVVGNVYSTGSLTTGAPSGGSIKPWKIGEAATVSPTSPNRTLRVEIDGVVYYIHAKTTND